MVLAVHEEYGLWEEAALVAVCSGAQYSEVTI